MSMQEKGHENQGIWKSLVDGRDNRYHSRIGESPSALPPPPLSTAYRPSLEAFHIPDDPMRQQGPRSSSPRMYGAAQSSLPPPPPPPPPPPQPVIPYGSRHMQPPSSPQYGPGPGPGPGPSHRDPPLQSPIGRDLPALPANTRPNSSMSILSMLGTDPGRPARDPPASTYPNASQPNGAFNSLMQYSTSATSPTKLANGSGPDHRDSPPTQNSMSGILNRPYRAYSGGSVVPGKRSSPAANALGFGLSPTEPPAFILGSASRQEKARENSRPISAGRTIERPNSQPTAYHPSPIDFGQRAREIDAHRAELARQEEAMARSGTGFSERARNSTLDHLGQQRAEALRQATKPMTHGSPQDDRTHTSACSFLSNPSVFSELTPKASGAEYSYTPRARTVTDDRELQHPVQKGPFDADALRRVREERLGAATVQQQQQQQQQQDLNRATPSARPRFLDSLDGRQDQLDNSRLSTVSSATAMERTRSIDSLGRNSEELNNHRHSLAIMLDNGKRGRISPLPQAVQGAQGRPSNTPSRDPGIKNEFSKMFAGIGSGVTGVGGSGASTPFPPSPRQSVENEQRPFGPPSDTAQTKEPRNGSRMGKRRSKAQNDDVDTTNGRMGVSADGRTIKRAKHNHRHHAHGHHHHRDEGTPLRNVSNPNGSTPLPHHNHHMHHHHHADGTIHHHHHNHTKQAAPIAEKPPPPPQMPKTIINNTAIFSAIANRPRHHLGSRVYAPKISPKAKDMAGSYIIPSYLGKENCTLTIRVPRYYLNRSSLLRITASRAIWGTDIYTDDSDPLCAAIHTGWIRGAWPNGIDVSMLQPGLQNISLQSNADDHHDGVVEAPPVGGPLNAAVSKDLHITILILPALEYYASHIAHGVKSRAWDATHDGTSFRIEKIAFVDDHHGAGKERTGAVRKSRIAALLDDFRTSAPAFILEARKLERPAMQALAATATIAATE